MVVGGVATSLSAAVGEPIGSVIIFATSNPISGLDQIGRIYYENAPSGSVNPRQLIRQDDQGKTFVVESSVYSLFHSSNGVPDPFPLQNTLASPLAGAENGIPYEFTIASQKEVGGGFPCAVSVVSPSGGEAAAELVDSGNNFTVKFTPTEDGEFVAHVTFTVTSSLKVSVAAMGTHRSWTSLTIFSS